jgi:hemerythrin
MINAPETWDPSLEVGHEDIDAQHRALFGMIVELDERLSNDESGQGVQDALQGMMAYAHTHFEMEEGLMAKAGWPGLTRHKGMHAEFMLKTVFFTSEYPEDSEWTALDMLRFLLTWLVDHIKVQDRSFFEWLKKQ